MLSFTITGTYIDLYELTKGQTYFLEGRQQERGCFDYFFRKLPFEGGYVVFAGLHDLLDVLEDLHFTEEDIRYLQELRLHPPFLDHLRGFQFQGTVYAMPECEIVFPNTLLVRVEGTILETQLVESLLLNILNFESLVATKAARMRQVAGYKHRSDFGLRRAHGPGAILAARAAKIGGFDSTSHVYAARTYGIPVAGTMAHSYIESYDDELEAFRAFARSRPDDCVFLVDTYHTLKSGVPNAIIVARELEQQGYRAKGIRLDSGDLATLAKAARKMLNEAGLTYVKTISSNQLYKHVIQRLLEQGPPVDVFGVGTKLVTGAPDAALDGVYKLAVAAGKPLLKLSETREKTTLPGIKQVLRLMHPNGQFYGTDVVILAEEGKRVQQAVYSLEKRQVPDLPDLKQQPQVLTHAFACSHRVLRPQPACLFAFGLPAFRSSAEVYRWPEPQALGAAAEVSIASPKVSAASYLRFAASIARILSLPANYPTTTHQPVALAFR